MLWISSSCARNKITHINNPVCISHKVLKHCTHFCYKTTGSSIKRTSCYSCKNQINKITIRVQWVTVEKWSLHELLDTLYI